MPIYVTPKINNQYNNSNLNCKKPKYVQQQSFTGVSQAYDKFCEGVGSKFIRHLLDNPLLDKLGHSIRNSENAIKHFMAVGSVITSGMYMKQTLSNKNMDKDRRQTLAVNQGFTLALSTLGAYTLDGYLKSWWSKQHERWMKLDANGKAIWDGMDELNKKIKQDNKNTDIDITSKVKSGELSPDLQIKDNKELKKLAKRFINSDKSKTFASKLSDIGINTINLNPKEIIAKVSAEIENNNSRFISDLKKMVQAEDYVRKLIEPTYSINDYIEKFGINHVPEEKTLQKIQMRSKGFGALRSILVFGFVYRFFVPLVVVKPTNWICDKYLEYKKSKNSKNLNNINA